MIGAYITLFCCLHVSDFDVITSGFTAATSNVSRLYFAAWYVMGVLLLLNIVKSFFLADFMGLVGRTAWKMPSPAEEDNSADEENADEADGEKRDNETRPSVSLAMRNRLIETLTTPAAEEVVPSRKLTLENEKGLRSNEASRKNSSAVHDSHDSGSVHSPILLDTTYSLHMPASEDEKHTADHVSDDRSPLKGNVGMLPTSEDTNKNYLISTFNCKASALSYFLNNFPLQLVLPCACFTVWGRARPRYIKQSDQNLVGVESTRRIHNAPSRLGVDSYGR